MSQSIAAIIVTYNRLELLRECLQALMAQTTKLDAIFVFDNASTDGTSAMLAQEFPGINVVSSDKNLGGAGGFHEGIKWAAERAFDWLWIMDDDSIANPDALAQLTDALEPNDVEKPTILASRVVWTDGDVHPMNCPEFRAERDRESWAVELAKGRVPIRSASFVSILVNQTAVKQHGLPWADYFIWNDDVEYTARILRNNSGYWVPASVVVHKTIKKRVERGDVRVERRYYSLRNRIWMILRSDAWSMSERILLLPTIVKVLIGLFREAGFGRKSLAVAYAGIKDGVFQKPRS